MKKLFLFFALLFFINSYNQIKTTPLDVISKYIEVIGGKDKLASVESIMMSGEFEIPQAPFKPSVIIKQQNPNKTSLVMSAPEMGTIMKQEFNGETGYMEQMGQNIPFSEDQINSSKSKKGIFEELYYDSSQLQVVGYTKIGGNDLVKIKIDDKTIKYYDINSGLLERSEETTLVEGNSITTTRKFSDYRDVDGILYPFKTEIINGMQTITIEFKEVKLNPPFAFNDKGFIVKPNQISKPPSNKYGQTEIPKNKSKRKPISPPINRNEYWLGNGSGIIISSSGFIVTNNHVIDDSNEIEVELTSNGITQKFNARLIKSDIRNDIAIIKIDDSNFDNFGPINYNFKTRSSDVGTRIYTFGYPKALSGMGKEIKVTEGIISSKSGVLGDITTYQITAPIQGGNSGGPLFDDKGNLVGINSSKFNSNETENVNYSIKSSYVLNLINELPKRINLPSSNKLQSLSLTEQIKEISKYVVLIKVK